MLATLYATQEDVLVSTAASRRADPDADVLELVARGKSKEALERLMHRYGSAVCRYCREALRDATLADDVHQQIFIGAFRDLPRFQGRSSVRTWLFAIAHHRVLDAVKQRNRAQAHFEEAETTEVPDLRPSPAESLDQARLQAALVASLGELNAAFRSAVLLRYQMNFSFEEMSEICREKPATLRARVARALPMLRIMIEARMRSGARYTPRDAAEIVAW